MIEFEEMKIENGFVTVFDEDGLITIQMEKKYVEEIMNFFNTYVQRKEHKQNDFYLDGNILKLNLVNFDDEFDINGRIYDMIDITGSYCHEFEFENCDIETWDKIFMFIKNN